MKDRIHATSSKGGIPVTAREWCVERVQTPDGIRSEARLRCAAGRASATRTLRGLGRGVPGGTSRHGR